MNQVEIICIAAVAGCAVVGACGIILSWLKKKGVNITAILEKVDSGLNIAEKAVDGIKAIDPNVPYISTAQAIIKYADVGVKQAEQLSKSSQIAEADRKTKAIELAKGLLTLDGITITTEVESALDGCVEAATNAIPQTHTPENDARYAAHAAAGQPETAETDASEEVTPAAEVPAEVPASASTAAMAAPASVSIDDLNQAAGIINAAIAEKVAAQTPTAAQPAPSESGAVAPSTTGAA